VVESTPSCSARNLGQLLCSGVWFSLWRLLRNEAIAAHKASSPEQPGRFDANARHGGRDQAGGLGSASEENDVLMRVITPNCRVQFTAEDIDFIMEVLGKRSGGKPHLQQLLADEPARDLLLDDPSLFQAIIEAGGCLRTSTHLYFYILVRNALKRIQIEDREVADYIAEMLAEFSLSDRSQFRVGEEAKTLEYFFEMMEALGKAPEAERFRIRAHMGNQSLFMTGVFPDRIRHRAETRGFPDISYYAALGQSSFREASHHRLATRYKLSEVFTALGDRFQEIRSALNQLADRVLFIDDSSSSLTRLLRPLN